jgi:hypothetical protein
MEEVPVSIQNPRKRLAHAQSQLTFFYFSSHSGYFFKLNSPCTCLFAPLPEMILEHFSRKL